MQRTLCILGLIVMVWVFPAWSKPAKKKAKTIRSPQSVAATTAAAPVARTWVNGVELSPFVTGFAIFLQDKINGGTGTLYSKISPGVELRWQLSGPVTPFVAFQLTQLSLAPSEGQTVTSSKGMLLGATLGCSFALGKKDPLRLSVFAKFREESSISTQPDGSLLVRPFWTPGLGAQISLPLYSSKEVNFNFRLGGRYIFAMNSEAAELQNGFEINPGFSLSQVFDTIRVGIFLGGIYQRLSTTTVDYQKVQLSLGVSAAMSL